MINLYYGRGECIIDEAGIRGIQLGYKGAITITDKTPESFVIKHNSRKIIIFPIGEGILKELFGYAGDFIITSVLLVNDNMEREYCRVNKMMDYAELMTSKSESISVNSEDLSAGFSWGERPVNTVSEEQILPNQHTLDYRPLYLKDGTEYKGYMHIHISTGIIMTGAVHAKESEPLSIILEGDIRGAG